MTEETSLVAQQVRLRQWAEQIRDCQNRPEGMDVSAWCALHNITKANYYTVLSVYGRHVWIRSRKQHILLLWNCLNQKVNQLYLQWEHQ